MALRFYNTLTQQVEPFSTKDNVVRMYSCGPTVYNFAHIGNFHTFLTSDLIVRAARLLQHASGTRLGAHIAIDKQLPAMAGLGGGSSDAASTLLALRPSNTRLASANRARIMLASLGNGVTPGKPLRACTRVSSTWGFAMRVSIRRAASCREANRP